jgi:hypothetical protein
LHTGERSQRTGETWGPRSPQSGFCCRRPCTGRPLQSVLTLLDSLSYRSRRDNIAPCEDDCSDHQPHRSAVRRRGNRLWMQLLKVAPSTSRRLSATPRITVLLRPASSAGLQAVCSRTFLSEQDLFLAVLSASYWAATASCSRACCGRHVTTL